MGLPSRSAPEELDPFESPAGADWLDPLIEPYVRALQEQGVSTFESCQETEGHGRSGIGYYPPWIRFHADAPGGAYKAVGIALEIGLPVTSLRQEWRVSDGLLVGPTWRMEFRPFSKSPCR